MTGRRIGIRHRQREMHRSDRSAIAASGPKCCCRLILCT